MVLFTRKKPVRFEKLHPELWQSPGLPGLSRRLKRVNQGKKAFVPPKHYLCNSYVTLKKYYSAGII
jgi:hypothetical protein